MHDIHDPQRCKHFGTNRCPNKKNEVLNDLDNLFIENTPNVKIKSDLFEKAAQVCAGCANFELIK
ncbi:MAG: hypothetical protein FP813_03515 [Desulfurivibrio sp.]|nr:hypothetical protein [Desulfurivibrio sp.]